MRNFVTSLTSENQANIFTSASADDAAAARKLTWRFRHRKLVRECTVACIRATRGAFIKSTQRLHGEHDRGDA